MKARRFTISAVLVSIFLLTLLVLDGGGASPARSQDAGFNYPDFSSTVGLALVGDATQIDNKLRLTLPIAQQAGAAWHITKQFVQDGFETTFQFQITDLGGGSGLEPGADGIVFVIQNNSVSALGFGGYGIGYHGIPNSLAVEFDTWHNSSWDDPNNNHVSVHTRGIDPNSVHHAYSLGSTTEIPDMSDGNVHTARIDYVPGTMRVYLDNLTEPALTVDVNLGDTLSLDVGYAWVGFTSATGGAWENHDLLSWSFGPGQTYSVSGHVRDDGDNPIPDVIVSAGASGSGTTDANGAYTITNLITGTYTFTPIKIGWTFSPTTRTVSVPPDAIGQDFTGTEDQGTGFNYPDFSSTVGLALVGDATQIDNKLRLTLPIAQQAGAAWHITKQFVQDGFETTFQFQITDLGGGSGLEPGADGIVFVIQNNSVSALGFGGYGIGYHGIPNSLAVEFDTWHNSSWDDPNNNHVSVHTRGIDPNSVHHAYSLGSTTEIPDMSDGNVHTARIDYVPGTMRVYLDNLTEPALTVDVNLGDILSLDGGYAWVGFTSATGAAWENHDLLSWSFNAGGAPEPPDPDRSSIEVAPSSLPADGTSTATITVTLRNTSDNPVPGKDVWLQSDRGAADDLEQPAAPTDANGQTIGYISSPVSGTAHITAVDLTDNVQLTQRATVTFTDQGLPPSEELLQAIDLLDRRSRLQINHLRNIALETGDHGDFFRGAIAADGAAFAFDLIAGFAGVAEIKQEMAQHAVQLAVPGLGARSWLHIDELKELYPTAGQLFNTAWRHGIRTGDWDNMSRYVLQDGFKYYAACLADEAIEEMTVKEWGEDLRDNARSESGMSTLALIFAQDADVFTQLLTDRHADLLNQGIPYMTTGEQEVYIDDLRKRSMVPVVLGSSMAHHARLLQNVRTAHETTGGPPWLFLLKFGAKNLARATFDGPGALLVSGFTTVFDAYLDERKLEATTRAYQQAPGILKGIAETTRRIYTNHINGLDRLAHRLQANPATGYIESVDHYSGGSYWGSLFWREDASYSDVWVRNTGDEAASFEVIAEYSYDTRMFCWPWASQPLISTAAITVAAGHGVPVRVYYKQGETGGSPDEGSNITIHVLATNETGTSYIDSDYSTWEPERAATSGFMAQGPAAVAQALDGPADAPTIENPIDSYVLSDPWAQSYGAQIWVANPFTASITAQVTQTVPLSVTLLETGDATLNVSTLTWQRTISAETVVPLTYTFRYSATPGVPSTLPAAQMGFYEPNSGQYLTTTSNVPTFQALWPVLVEGYVPWTAAGTAATMPVTITNLLTESVSGSMMVSILDADGTGLYSQTLPFTLPPTLSDTLSFSLPSTLPNGIYPLEGTLHVQGASQRVLSDEYRVGAFGPLVGAWSDPAGFVYPDQTLTYTVSVSNTTGLTLTGGILTATLPVSTSLIPGSVSDGGRPSNGWIRWDLDSLADGAVVTATFQVQVASDAVGWDEALPIESLPLFASDQTILTFGFSALNTVVRYSPPVAAFTASPTSGVAPLTVVFTNTSTGHYTASLWHFGEVVTNIGGITHSHMAAGPYTVALTQGVTSTQESPTHTYTLPGVYTVALTVSGPGGTDTLTRSRFITVCGAIPGGLHAWPTSGVAPLTVVFTNTSGGDYTASLWDFGDGVTSTLEGPTHIYTTARVYTVTLTVSGPEGTATLTRPRLITVYAPVQAAFAASLTSGAAPLTVVFTNTSTGDYTASLWDFGDGVTSALESPTNTYTTAGVYTVALRVSGPGGSDTETKVEYIIVSQRALEERRVYLPLILRRR